MPPFTAVVVEGYRVSMSRSSARTPFGPLVGLLTCNVLTRRRAAAQLEKMTATAVRCRISLFNRSTDCWTRVSVQLWLMLASGGKLDDRRDPPRGLGEMLHLF